MPQSVSFSLLQGESPVLVSLPHAGTDLMPGQEERMTPTGRARPDTDWHLTRLYDFAPSLGIGVLSARYSRYVIDLNRGPDDATLYPGRPKTGLVPCESFDGLPLYREGERPDAPETDRRRQTYWAPYHEALTAELNRLRSLWGWAVLWDGHSIRSRVPRLFEGRLPDLNLGTNDGASCAASLRALLAGDLAAQQRFSFVVDGRFKGGYTTRHYGRPGSGIHAVQMEMTQSSYLDAEAPPWPISDTGSDAAKTLLRSLLRRASLWRP
ncbi:N-formylglutamate deformylase [Swaminathania salitolerans]|uniref:N-formylglutamate deformylase n=1 Tax=Swaminathania salitolerans TaxID=182838 RepID=A0A511BXF0_9PROT|nr:N-formylglutamate deformylase [Swaminathania salitolerans]GBQ12004.1 N-formylglutamate amidohydrolase [Swaminathania salitolerans LMG 21291]GEL02698.1 N-formylglutamate deformylase [Swaminathania salitolerans]